MANAILPRIAGPSDLKALSEKELEQLAAEMRAELIRVVGSRPAHFASNLGVVELCLRLPQRSDHLGHRSPDLSP